MRRVVITGMGVVSSIGDNVEEVANALYEGRSGVAHDASFAEHGFKCQVSARPKLNFEEVLDRRTRRFMGEGAGWNYIAMAEALAQSGLSGDEVSHPMTGIIMGSGGPSTKAIVEAADITRANGSPKRIGPTVVPKAMASTNSATLAVPFKILGVNYSISSACATSVHCIGAAAEQIMWGKQDIVFAGGGEELDWTLANIFDAMGAMSTATASSSPAARRRWCWRSMSARKNAAPIFSARSSAISPIPTATTWCSCPAKAPSGACGARSKPCGGPSITSIRTAPRRRSATRKKPQRSAKFSVLKFRPSHQRNH